MLPEADLELMLLRQVAGIRQEYPCWHDPEQLSRALEIRLVAAGLGSHREGAALTNMIAVDPALGGPARRRFTLYHEIMHQLIKRNDALYSVLHDQYHADADFERICERLCNLGAAELLIPRAIVRDAINERGFSLQLLPELSVVTTASRTAICVQLVLLATHRCIGIVCRLAAIAPQRSHAVITLDTPSPVLHVETAVSSASMEYRITRGTRIPAGHLLQDARTAAEGELIRGVAQIPFRNVQRPWEVDCEAMRIGEQVFALFHAGRPVPANRDQLALF